MKSQTEADRQYVKGNEVVAGTWIAHGENIFLSEIIRNVSDCSDCHVKNQSAMEQLLKIVQTLFNKLQDHKEWHVSARQHNGRLASVHHSIDLLIHPIQCGDLAFQAKLTDSKRSWTCLTRPHSLRRFVS